MSENQEVNRRSLANIRNDRGVGDAEPAKPIQNDIEGQEALLNELDEREAEGDIYADDDDPSNYEGDDPKETPDSER